MSLFGLLKLNAKPLEHDIEDSFDGNLCRCTGYRPILEAARSFTSKLCDSASFVDYTQFKAYDPNSDIPFPSSLVSQPIETFCIFDKKTIWFQPICLSDLLKIKQSFPDAKLVNGSTEILIEMKLKRMYYSVFVNVCHVDELKVFELKENVLEIGANTTLTEMIVYFKDAKHSFVDN